MRDPFVEGHERRIQGVFRKAWVDNGWSAAVDETPLSSLLEEEYEGDDFDGEAPAGEYAWPAEHGPSIELQSLKLEEANRVAAFVRRRLVMWIVGDGLHPFRLCQRLYALLFARYPEFTGPLNQTDYAKILGEGRAAFCATVKMLFTKPIKDKTGLIMVSAGMKSAESREAYAENARTHTPRRRHDAAKLDTGTEKQAAAKLTREQQQKLRAAREGYERRRLADMVGCKPEEIDLSKCNPE